MAALDTSGGVVDEHAELDRTLEDMNPQTGPEEQIATGRIEGLDWEFVARLNLNLLEGRLHRHCEITTIRTTNSMRDIWKSFWRLLCTSASSAPRSSIILPVLPDVGPRKKAPLMNE